MQSIMFRLLLTALLCLGLLGATADGLALAGIYDDASADVATEVALDVACNSATTVRVASRATPASIAFSTPLFLDDSADVPPPHRLRTPPRAAGSWRIRMLTARRAQTGRSK